MNFFGYCEWQSQQIQQLEYKDTHQLTVAVLLPKRSNLLLRDLKKQLHPNYVVIDDIETLKRTSFDTLFVASEDVSMMSVALGYFADAIQNGVDFCYGDCCFGMNGETRCYYPDNIEHQKKMIAVGISEVLFRSLELPADTSPEFIIGAAQAASKKSKHIPFFFFWCHHPIQAADIFPDGKARALLYTHEYSMTGAPLVLLGTVPEFERENFSVVSIGPLEGNVLPSYQKAGVTAVVDEGAVKDASLAYLALDCDLILANTICECGVVAKLSAFNVPTIWWIHDAAVGYPYLAPDIPQRLSDRVHVYCVSEYARKIFLKYCPNTVPGILMYGVADTAELPSEEYLVPHSGKTLFTTIGSLEPRKGYDVLFQMIEKMPREMREKCKFLIVGKIFDQTIGKMGTELAKRFPENVCYESYIPRDQINSVFHQTDCVICASKDDPLPTFVTEGWMNGVPCICSENTGSASLIQDGVNSYIYPKNDSDLLLEKVKVFLKMNPQEREKMKKASRRIYDENFTINSFENNLFHILSVLENGEKRMKE